MVPRNSDRALQLLDQALELHRRHRDTTGYANFIELMLREYYDPMYDYQLGKKQQRVIVKGTADELLEWADKS